MGRSCAGSQQHQAWQGFMPVTGLQLCSMAQQAARLDTPHLQVKLASLTAVFLV